MAWQEVPNPAPYEIALRRAAKRSQFLVDESLGPATRELLRSRRINVVGVWEVGLTQRDDEDVLAYAWRHRRILLTHDDDFWNDRQFPEHRNPGIVILPGAKGDQVDMINGLIWLLQLMDRDPGTWRKKKVRITRDGDVYVKGRLRTGVYTTRHYRITNKQHDLQWV